MFVDLDLSVRRSVSPLRAHALLHLTRPPPRSRTQWEFICENCTAEESDCPFVAKEYINTTAYPDTLAACSEFPVAKHPRPHTPRGMEEGAPCPPVLHDAGALAR